MLTHKLCGAKRTMLRRGGVPLLRGRSTRAMSLLGSIFGIGEFEGARNTSLSRSTSKQQAYDVALLDVRGSHDINCDRF